MQSKDHLELKFSNNFRVRSISVDEMELRSKREGPNSIKKSPKNFIKLFFSYLMASSGKV